jgi:hypothetical protein
MQFKNELVPYYADNLFYLTKLDCPPYAEEFKQMLTYDSI